MGLAEGLVLLCLLYGCCFNRCCCAASPTDTTALAPSSCNDPANTKACFEASVPYKLVLQETETAVLRCIIRNLNKQVVTWMRNDGRDIPMTIGQTVFTPDARVSLDNSIPDEWNLVIRRVEVKDSGEYLCQVNGRLGLMARAYALVVEESKAPSRSSNPVDKADQNGDKRFLSDDQEAKNRGKSDNVRIDAEDTVFEGTLYFPLTCTVNFGSRDAKASPRVAIEWYHQGMRQTVNVSSMDISMSWTDSDRAISVLTVYRVLMRHSGDWVCLKRPAEIGVMETATHTLTVLARESPLANAERNPEPALASASLGIRSAADRTRSASSVESAPTAPPALLAVALLAASALSRIA